QMVRSISSKCPVLLGNCSGDRYPCPSGDRGDRYWENNSRAPLGRRRRVHLCGHDQQNLTNEQKNPSSKKKRRVVLVAVLSPLGVHGSSLYINLFCRSQSSETGKTNSCPIPPLNKPRASCPNP